LIFGGETTDGHRITQISAKCPPPSGRNVVAGFPVLVPQREGAVPEDLLRAYFDRKRPMVVWSIVFAVLAGVVVSTKAPIAGIALVFGTGCGIANALLTMRGNERLVDHKSVATFVTSSILRIGVFGIVPVEFALHGPWWTMIAYFIGFFTPLALYTALVARAVRTG
jgi:hypothetical protein